MNKRPVSVIVLSWVLTAAGAVGLVYHFHDFHARNTFQYDAFWVAFVRLLAIVSGIGMLRGSDWARWLALAWIAFHVVISAFHSASEFLVHTFFLAVFAFILFRPSTREYFRHTKTKAP